MLIRHLNKKSGEPVLYRGGGSIGILAQARSAIVAGKSPEDAELRVMASNKASLWAAPKSLAFHIEHVSNEFDGGTSRVRWLGQSDLTAADIVAQPKQQGRPSKAGKVAEYIGTLLANGKRMPEKNLRAAVMASTGNGEVLAEALYRAKELAKKQGDTDRAESLTQRLKQVAPDSRWNK